MKKRVWFLFILFFGMFFIPKSVFAATFNKLYYFDSNFNVIGEYTTPSHGYIQNVKYVRCSYTDTFIANYNYQLNFSYSIKGVGSWPYMVWNNAGLNVGGTYVKGAPDAQTIIDEELEPPVYYYRQIVYPFAWKQTNGGEFPVFVQLELQNAMALNYFSCDSFIMSYTSDTGDNSDIINNQNINTQITVNNDNQNTQNIINNQNENTDKQIEAQMVCNTVNINKDKVISSGFLYTDGSLLTNDDYGVTDYVSIFTDSTITVTKAQNSVASTCFYDSSKSLISCLSNSNQPVGSVSIPSGARYVRFSIYKPTDIPNFTVKSCTNGNQALSDDINNMTDILNDHNTSDIDFTFGDIDTISDTPISDLLLLPLELVTKITTSLGSGCMSWSLPFNLWGNSNYTLVMPCINLQTYLGSTVWNVIDDMCCIFMIYNIFKMLIRFFESWTSLNDTFDDVVGGVH